MILEFIVLEILMKMGGFLGLKFVILILEMDLLLCVLWGNLIV